MFDIKNLLITLTGPSGSGKSTIEKILVEKYDLRRAISHTTREMRVNEKITDYHFISTDVFNELYNDGKFVEYTNYNGNMYGVTIDELLKSNILVVEPQGLKQIKTNLNNNEYLKNRKIISFFFDITEEEVRKRMEKRGDSIDKIESRIKNDKERFYKDNDDYLYDYTINVCDKTPTQIVECIKSIVNGEFENKLFFNDILKKSDKNE